MPEERLQKLMARAGIASRRACEAIILERRVTVNGEIATLGTKADPARDDIRVDGERLRPAGTFDYVMLNKPPGVISDEDVAGNWPRARDLIPLEGHLYAVGRLDIKSEGLMLFTNDGELAHRLTHPRYEHPKTYRVLVAGKPDDRTLDNWRRGIVLDESRTHPADVQVIRRTREGTLLQIVMTEGRKRQIRRVAAALGHPAIRLERVGLGPLELGDLPPGAWRRLTDEEVAALRLIREARSRRPGGRPPAAGRRERRPAAPGPARRRPDSRPGAAKPGAGKPGSKPGSTRPGAAPRRQGPRGTRRR